MKMSTNLLHVVTLLVAKAVSKPILISGVVNVQA